MFDWITTSSLKFRFLILSMAAAVVAIGALQVRKMPVDVFPEFAPPIVEVQTEAIGLSAEEVENMLTYSLEELLGGLPWLESTRSRSVTGLSSVVLIFKRGTDIMKARQLVQERLALAYTLPNVATPPVILQPVSATSRFMMVALSSDTIDPTELSLLARWTLKPRLVGVPGVSNVSIWGQRLRQLHVHFDPDRLRANRVTQDDIVAATGDALWVSPLTFLKASSPGSGGWIDNKNQRLGVEHAMPIETPEDLAKVAVTSPHVLLAGRSMSLGDITETTFSHAPVIGDAIVGKGGSGLMLVIEKFPGANTLDVTRDVQQALNEMSRGLPGVKVEANVFRLADYVEESISNLTGALLIGAALVVLAIGACLSNWRSALVGVVTLPLSLMTAVLALHFTGATINTMVLAGLVVALAVVIDSAVVDALRLRDRLEAPRESGQTAFAFIREATLQTQGTAIYATLIVVLATLPIFFMGGVAGAFFEPLALSYLLAVGASMLVALSVTPVLSLMLMEKAVQNHGAPSAAPAAAAGRTPLLDRLQLNQRYERSLSAVVASPWAASAAALVLILLAAGSWPFLAQSLLPQFQERGLLVNWSTPPGTSHVETYRITSRVSKELESLPGVKSVGAHIGRAVTGDQVVGINSSQIWVTVDASADYEKTLDAIRTTLDGYPGIDHNLQSYLRDKVGEILTGQSKPIVVRLFGPQREVLAQKAEEVRQAVASVPGIVDLGVEGQGEEAHVKVKVNLDAAGKANVKPGDVRRSSASVFSGMVAGYLFKDQKIFEVVVWGAPEARQSLNSLNDLWVEKSDRTHSRLGDVADVSIASTPVMMRHENRAPYVDVVANVNGRDAGAVTQEVAQRLAAMKFPLEYHAELLGEYAQRTQANRRMLGVAAAALVGIFLLLQACFRNWSLAGVAVLAMLTSVAGGALAAAAAGSGVSMGSLIGLLAALGIAARQNVFLISGMQSLEQQGMHKGLALVLQATQQRLPAILLSCVATVLALLPIIFAGPVAGLEVVRPTAIVMVGGIIVSTLTTLFVVPSLVLLIGSGARREIDLGVMAHA